MSRDVSRLLLLLPMTDPFPDAPPSPESALALAILQVFQEHARRSGIDPLHRLDATDVPQGRAYSIAIAAAKDLLEWARKHAPEEPC